MRINLTSEEKKAYHVSRIELVDEKTEFAWVVKFTEDQLEAIYEDNVNLIKDGEEYESEILELIYRKMKAKVPKTKKFKAEMLGSLPEAVSMAFGKVMELTGLDKVKVEQTKLEMPKNEKE